MEPLTEDCNTLLGDFQRQEAFVSQRDGVIAELRDKVCTLWASRWPTFQRRAAKVFSGLDFNFYVPNDEEEKESVSEDEIDPEVYSNTPNSILLPDEPKVPSEAGSSLFPTGASPSNLHVLEARTTVAAYSSASNI